jgi:hypothetical protein
MPNPFDDDVRDLQRGAVNRDASEDRTREVSRALANITDQIEQMASDHARFRIWESMLYLLFARHYRSMPEPLAEAFRDRAYLLEYYNRMLAGPNYEASLTKIFENLTKMVESEDTIPELSEFAN